MIKSKETPLVGTTTKYTLNSCQVKTPPYIISGVWRLISEHRSDIKKVIDLGAGDGRFSIGGKYEQYLGIEIDPNCERIHKLPENAILQTACAFEIEEDNFDLCIGNPPYIRHHELDKTWLKKMQKRFAQYFGITLSLQANLFVFFMCLALQKTKNEGLVALVVPFEWINRPSAKSFRDLISRQKWNVSVYSLVNEVFEGVLTTACIVLIDKANCAGEFKFYNIDQNWNISKRKGPTGSGKPPITYEDRGSVWAMRGMSPGTQTVFTLTENERIKNGLLLDDVRPCITSLKPVSKNNNILNMRTFRKYYVNSNEKCWLIKSDEKLSPRLKKYLKSVNPELHNTATCNKRSPWYLYKTHSVPKILYASGFVNFGPKILDNKIKAIPVGSVHGIYSKKKMGKSKLIDYLLKIDFEKQVVPQAGTLKKIEVRQMNSILNSYSLGNC